MARKRLILDPPPAISSSEEEEETDDEEEEEHRTVKTQQSGTGEKRDNDEDGSKEEEDDEEDDEEVGKEQPDLLSKPSKPNSDSDSADTESGQPPSPSLSDFTIKPIPPKRKPGPKLEQPKKEKDDDEDKKAKRGAGPRTGGSQRIWSDEDEIVLLNGMIEYQNEMGKSPFVDTSDFYGFVKESLHFNASTNQFSDKIRRLKKKYYTDVEKNESGKDVIFSKPHDLECVELAKKIWGAGGIDVGSSGKNVVDGGGGGGGGGVILALAKMGSVEVNRKEKEVSVKRGKRGSSEEVNGEGKEGNVKRQKRGLNEEADWGEEGNVKRGTKDWSEEVNGEGKGEGGKKEKVKMVLGEKVSGEGKGNGGKREKQAEKEELNGGEEGSENLWEKHPFLYSSLQAADLPEDAKERAMVMLAKVQEEKLVELEREWTSLMNAKLELFIKEKDLIAKQVRLALDALKSQD